MTNWLNPVKKGIIHNILDVIYPEECPICGRKPSIASFCENCAKIYLSGQRATVSNEIIAEKLTTIFAIDNFNPQIKKIIHDLKYNSIEKQAVDIMRIGITPFYDELKAADLITSVPLHPFRFLRRGYNQAEILAKTASEELQIPYEKLLLRTRYNLTQTKKKKKNRKIAVAGLFAMRKKKNIADKTIIIVDDVCTTTATISECAKVLYAAGAKKVIVLCLARV